MQFDVENRYVLDLVQALVGAITPNMREVGIRSSDPLILYFLLERESDEDREEIDDIVFEFRALQDNPLIDLTVDVIVSNKPLLIAMAQRPNRVVFSRKLL